MLKRMVIAAILAVGASPAALAADLMDRGIDTQEQQTVAALAQGCLGSVIDWLPGTLQIDDQAKPNSPAEAEASPPDCALV